MSIKKYTYKIKSKEIFCLSLCVFAKTANCFPLLKSLKYLWYECKMVVFIRLWNISKVTKGCLDHIAEEEVQELSCVTLFTKHEEATSSDVLKEQSDSQWPHFHVSFLLVLNDLLNMTFNNAEWTKLGIQLIELVFQRLFNWLKAILGWLDQSEL